MSFLKNTIKTTTTEGTATPTTKPALGKLKIPAPAKKEEGTSTPATPSKPNLKNFLKPKTEATDTTEETAKKETVKPAIKKPNLKAAIKSVDEEETKVEQTTEETVVVEQVAEVEEVVQETVQEEVKEEVATETIKEEVVEETVQEEVKETTAVEETTSTVEEKPKKGRGKGKTKKAEVAETVNAPAPTGLSYDAMVNALAKPVDNTWEEFKQNITEKLNAIRITPDMNLATLKATIAQLDEVRQLSWYDYCMVRTNYEVLTKDQDGLLRRTRKINATGSNAEERERNGYLACMNYVSNGQTINLYEYHDMLLERFNFLDQVMRQVEFKRNLLITMNGALKLEQETLQG